MIDQVKEEMQADNLEWIMHNVANSESRQIAIEYKVKFVPTTIINGTKWLVGVSSPEQLKKAILEFK